MVQWLRLYTANAGVAALIPGWGTKILHAVQHGQKIIYTHTHTHTHTHTEPGEDQNWIF